MSKTLSEDSEGKRASAADFGVRQLFRRPAPTTAGSTVDWAVANGDSDFVVSNNSAHNITYDSVDIPTDSTHFAVGTSNIRPIKIVRDGWYMLYLEAWPGGLGFPGDYGVGIAQSGSGFFYNFSYSAGTLFPRRIHYIKNTALIPGFQETFGPVYCVAKTSCLVGGFVYHYLDTPGTIDWNFGTLVITALGDGVDLPPNDGGHWAPDGEDNDNVFRTSV